MQTQFKFWCKNSARSREDNKMKVLDIFFLFSLFNLATDFYLTPKERRMFLNWIGSQAWLDEHKQI